MTSTGQAESQTAVSERMVGARSLPWRAIGVACGMAALLLVVTPEPAYAWWGKLEKLSGPRDLTGPQFDFRVVCFGDLPKGAALAKEAAEISLRALGSERDAPAWRTVSERWTSAAQAWASYLNETFTVPVVPRTDRNTLDYETHAAQLRTFVERFAERAKPTLMSTSSAGVLGSFCKPVKERRFSLDVGLGAWSNNGSVEYANGEPIKLNTLMTSISWRVFPDKRWDVLQISAGGGLYWFTSEEFAAQRGFVMQPGRLTVQAPSSWSQGSATIWKRLLALPVYGIGFTVFPSGFEASDFGGVGDAAVRIPSELVVTHYFFLNWQPLLHLGK